MALAFVGFDEETPMSVPGLGANAALSAQQIAQPALNDANPNAGMVWDDVNGELVDPETMAMRRALRAEQARKEARATSLAPTPQSLSAVNLAPPAIPGAAVQMPSLTHVSPSVTAALGGAQATAGAENTVLPPMQPTLSGATQARAQAGPFQTLDRGPDPLGIA